MPVAQSYGIGPLILFFEVFGILYKRPNELLIQKLTVAACLCIPHKILFIDRGSPKLVRLTIT
jgi:hypothetical protein